MENNENFEGLDVRWYGSYKDIPKSLEYPDDSLYETIVKTTKKYPNNIAYNYFGVEVSYIDFLKQIDEASKSFKKINIQKGDKVTICMPNTPEAIISFYALNKIGAIANMVHPLSAQNEIKHYLKLSESVAVLTIDLAYKLFKRISCETKVKNIIVASPSDSMPKYMKLAYRLTQKKVKISKDKNSMSWKSFIKLGENESSDNNEHTDGSHPAAILYSGGTTGKPKGILLSNLNFNSLAIQGLAMAGADNTDSMLSIMPIFHGFGLGVCVHTVHTLGATSILIPRFDVKNFHKLLKKHKPTFMAGVPTLWEAMIKNKKMESMDLSYLKVVISGGDSLSVSLKRRMDEFLKNHGAKIQVREGYGLTECVTGTCLNPVHESREGSVGIPYPDTFYKIVKPGTKEKVAIGEEGEICLSAPTVMLEYLNEPAETANVLKVHDDGLKWLHTGDLGYMDEDGWIYFKLRIKRLIVSSGYNIYPQQLENIIDAHPYVHVSSVIGIPHPYKIQVAKVFIVLKNDVKVSEEVKNSIRDYCKKNLAKFAMPYEFEYRDELPKTLVNKVDYTRLERESIEKLENNS